MICWNWRRLLGFVANPTKSTVSRNIPENKVHFGACVFTYLEMLKGSGPVVASVREGPQSPEEPQKIPALFHPEITTQVIRTAS